MLRRILRSAVVLGVIIAAYEVYATLAVPLMEPPLALREQHRITDQEINDTYRAVTKYQLLLSNYFPKTHWSQTQPPKVIANATEQFMLVFDEFQRSPGSGQNADGSPTALVNIAQIAVLYFPTPPREGVTPPEDAVILEASQGARLEFDEFRPEVGKIGQIIRGNFPGLIRIHSNMRDPGPADDLLIETSDLQMNTKLMYTAAPVRFRMGPNVGGGTELEIRFLADDHLKPGDPGLRIAGIDSLEIRRDVRMQLQMDAKALLPRDAKQDANAVAAHGKDNQPRATNPAVQVTNVAPPKSSVETTPIDVSCTGPFTFDFVRYVASLDHDVEVRQVNANGPCDQLTCSRLDIHFAPKSQANTSAPPAVVDAGKRQQQEIANLEPVAIVAEGHPAVIVSPSRGAQARGDRIHIVLHDKRVRISGGSDAILVYGTNVLQAPVIDYQDPAENEGTKVGRFRATGPGSLHYVVDPAKAQQVLQAEWQTSVQLGREKGQPVLALDGRPKIAFAEAGSLSADQIRMYLRELEGHADEGFAIGGKENKTQNKLQLAPDRMLATGNVEIASPQFTGHVRSLTATFRPQPNNVNSGATAPTASGDKAGGKSSAKTPQQSPSNAPPKPATTPSQRYFIDTDQLHLEISMNGTSPAPTTMECTGNVLLREIPQVATNDQPLEIRGGQLLVDRLDTQTPHVILHGAGPGQPLGAVPAQLTGRGVTVLTDTVELDGQENRMWSDGPGKATMLNARNLAGNPTATPQPMELNWQGGMKFDGQRIYVERDVTVTGNDLKLRCDQLGAKLSAPVKFGDQFDRGKMQPNEIECVGHVIAENVMRDAQGVTSHQVMQLARLTYNQQTGDFTGDGPGTVRSTQFDNNRGGLLGQHGAQPLARTASSSTGSKLSFLRVDFHRGLKGNQVLRELTFQERVRTVYGPVDSWEQELDPTRPETLPPETITLTCDNLRLNEDALAAREAVATGNKTPNVPVQMMAQGDVRIAGQVPNQGEFSVQAGSATYEQAKDAFVLEGDGRTPAKLWRRNATGVDSAPTEAHKIRYTLKTNQVKVEGFQYLEITPNDVQNARRPTPPNK